MDSQELATRFKYHPPTSEDIADAHSRIREYCEDLALSINHIVKVESREKSLALTAVQEAMMWANAAIAIYQKVKVD